MAAVAVDLLELIFVDSDRLDQIRMLVVKHVYQDVVAFIGHTLQKVALTVYNDMFDHTAVLKQQLGFVVEVLFDDLIVTDLRQLALGFTPVETLLVLAIESQSLRVAQLFQFSIQF